MNKSSKRGDLPTNQPVRLYNATCPYCGVELGDHNTTKEHVVARRFVPVGSLHQQPNLIVNACRDCNQRKAELEDDLSALSMHPGVGGWRGHETEKLKAEAVRKSEKSISKTTRKPVKDSHEKFDVNLVADGFSMKVSMTGGPQIDFDRARDLAIMQARAFFYWFHYDQETNHGKWWLGQVFEVDQSKRNDWGNVRARWFASLIECWKTPLHFVTAEGHFKLTFKWSSEYQATAIAIEWNQSYRQLFLLAEPEVIEKLATEIPQHAMRDFGSSPSGVKLRGRTEIPLDEADDRLFDFDPSEDSDQNNQSE